MVDTHAVTNQPPPLVGYDVFRSDAVLVEAVERFGAGAAAEDLSELGRVAGSEEAQRWADEANRYPPVLRTHDRYGHRIDEVEYHPSYHRLMETSVGAGLHGAAWTEGRSAAHVTRAAGFMVWNVDAGHGCPISMTYAAVPALRSDERIAAEWIPRLSARQYEPRPLPGKSSALAGMAMTEKQGGSDVRANTTRAEAAGEDGWYRLTGHKWFCSAPMGDLFLVLAQTEHGVTCFVVPRTLPDGTRNVFRLQRLKDKLGNRSNASSEVEFDGTLGQRLGSEGRGVPTIVEMVNATRLDCVLGSAAGMRAGVAQATHHAAHRSAFGRDLVDQPAMSAVLADLAIESEAATLLALRLANAIDSGEVAFRRLATAVAKYFVCKRAPGHAAESLECLGGNGYVEDSGMPRLYREAPLNGLWEGSGNVNALDVLRAMARTPESVQAFFTEVGLATGADARLDRSVTALQAALGSAAEASARRLVEQMALVLQGSLLVRYGHPAVADAFCATRLGGDWGMSYGTLPAGVDTRAIVERARPKLG
ncbi:MAG TPA: acyl-CoA dehydrogenase family protein [Frankiaceae bacterium]|nr:acyl-CoA dehydrogenase family protein [Frankiaceae bacterium]